MAKTIKPNYESIFVGLGKITENIYKELGAGFDESVVQNAFAIEFRENSISYLKELNIEVFYKGHYVGVDRPDFVLFPSSDNAIKLNVPLVLELKAVTGAISSDHRAQLKSYFKSLPKNKNHDIRNITLGMLVKFTKTEDFKLLDEEPETDTTDETKKKPPKEKPKFEMELWEFDSTKEAMNLIARFPEFPKKEVKKTKATKKTK
ncbi:MAG: GxxExxY protein [Ignavibacteria bacterium]